jgi:hypothetical protein
MGTVDKKWGDAGKGSRIGACLQKIEAIRMHEVELTLKAGGGLLANFLHIPVTRLHSTSTCQGRLHRIISLFL